MTTILVVDDEPDVEVLLAQKFRRRTASGEIVLRFACDGQDALDALARDPAVDLILADINMPRMDGLTLLARLQESENPVATIIVSAYGDMANIRTAMNRGAFDFVTKPIDFADLEMTIAKTIRHVSASREARDRRIEAERAHAALARYFSPKVALALTDNASGLSLAGVRRDISTIFTDIADFTRLAEVLEPERLSWLLNRYLTGMSDIVFAHDGTVAKIMGDALHILFSAPVTQPDHAARATTCALALDGFAEALRLELAADGIALGATRIGVHSGPALVGNFGGDRYLDYTAYGDTINTAARLEGANKALGTRICVSGETAARVSGFHGRPMGEVLLRGRRSALEVYEPLASPMPAQEQYLNAFELMAREDPRALAAFESLAKSAPDDPLVDLHLGRLRCGLTGILLKLT